MSGRSNQCGRSVTVTYPVTSPHSAPTGSGKTVLFELSIIHMLVNSSGRGTEKCVYVAPTKVCLLASFRVYQLKRRRRYARNGPGTGWKSSGSLALNVRCPTQMVFARPSYRVGCELTGDTVQPSRSIWGDFRGANIMWSVSFCVLLWSY